MEIKDLLELTRAGFTKEEIMALTSGSNVVQPIANEGASTNSNELQNEPVVKTLEDVPAQQPQTQTVTLTQDQLKSLVQGIAVQTASGAIEMPKDTTQVLGERLQSLMKGE